MEEEVKDVQGGSPEVNSGAGSAAEVATDESKQSGLSRFKERVRSARPNGAYSDDDDEEYFNQAESWIDELQQDSARYKAFSDKLLRRFEEDPDEAQAILAYTEGTPLVAAIRQYKGDEALTMEEGKEGWDEYQKAGEARKQLLKDQQSLIDELRKNDEESNEVFEEWATEIGLDEEQKEAVRTLIMSDLENMSKGKITKDMYNRYRDAMNHDKDVDGARRQGEIDGKNQSIEARRSRMTGSGLPNGSAGGNAGGGEDRKEVDAREEMAQHFAGFKRR